MDNEDPYEEMQRIIQGILDMKYDQKTRSRRGLAVVLLGFIPMLAGVALSGWYGLPHWVGWVGLTVVASVSGYLFWWASKRPKRTKQ